MEVFLSKGAVKNFQKLTKKDQAKVKKKLATLQNLPESGKKLTGELKGIYSLRAWPYRILYEINKNKKRVEVHSIIHRQSSYK